MGIADSKFNPNHNLLSGQFFYLDYNGYNPDYKDNGKHGTNVAGVAGGKSTDGKYYGVAYNAKMAGFGEFGWSIRPSWGDKNLVLKNGIKIINNSWGYENIVYYEKERDIALEDLATNHKVLMVFASGNESDTNPHFPANNPRYNEKLQSWLAVGNLDAHHISRDSSGTIIVTSRGISTSSNLCIGASRFCVMASGTDITTADGNSNDRFVRVTGTSFSAPLTSGVAALVQEKFPFMDGKQLADTILSTANSDFQAPKIVIKGKTLIYIDSEIPSDTNEIYQDIINAYGTNVAYTSIIKHTKEEVFGQGIVDAKKALGGLALIDINRLSDSDAQQYKSETKQAFYTIDTKGFSGVFSNDINERQWDSKYHDSSAINKPTQLNGLNAGLIKTSVGNLTITGDLNYLGATIIQGGDLSLWQGKVSALSVKGNVYVESQGTFSAFGDVNLNKNLNNNGGVWLDSQSNLNVKGTYTQEGAESRLTIGFTQSDINNNHFALKSANYEIKSGKLIYAPKIANYKDASYRVPLENALLNQVDKFSSVELENISNVLNYGISSDKKQITATTKPNAYENFSGASSSDKLVAKALRNIASQNLNVESTAFFEKLNIASQNNYKKAIQSLDNNAHLAQSSEILRSQSNNNLRQILSTQSIAKNSARFTLTPYYSYAFGIGAESGTQFTHFAGSHLSFNKAFENIALGGFFSYGNYNSAFENATFSTHTLQGGVNLIGDIASFLLIVNASVGGAFSDMERTIGVANLAQNLKGKYSDLLLGANVGVGYNIKISRTTLTPQVLFGYGFIKKGAFKENSEVLPMEYDSLNHNALSAFVGLNWHHKFLANDALHFGIYAFYERNILGANISGKSRFKGDSTIIPQSYAMRQDNGLFGTSIGYNGNRGFVNFILDSEINAKRASVGAMMEFGMKFGGSKKNIRKVKKARKIKLDSANRPITKPTKSAESTKDAKAH